MTKIPCAIKALLTGLLLCAVTPSASATDKNCWADFFEEAQYKGEHVLIEGANQFATLNNLNGGNWENRIHSLKVGSHAKLTVYKNPRFELSVTDMVKNPDLMHSLGVTEQDVKEDSELIFIANSTIHDLGDFGFHKKIRSLKLECL